jgi:hypothetical protein
MVTYVAEQRFGSFIVWVLKRPSFILGKETCIMCVGVYVCRFICFQNYRHSDSHVAYNLRAGRSKKCEVLFREEIFTHTARCM